MTDVIGQCSKCGGPNYIGHMCVWAVDNFKFVDRYAELEKRIKALEDKVSPDSPAPASTPTLVEAVGEYFGWMDSGEAYRTGYELQDTESEGVMRLSDARKILSGELVPYEGTQEVCLVKADSDHNDPDNWRYLDLTKKDFEFCLRQLALKVEKEKGK